MSIQYQKELQRISRYENNLSSNYKWMDYKEKALAFDKLVFDKQATGQYLPLIWDDTNYKTFGIPAYVGDGRFGKDGEQEAVTAIAAILSATLLGVDKSNQEGVNYVSQISGFYSYDEKIVLNNPKGSSETTSMWYLLYPAILFTQVSFLYPKEQILREQSLDCIESWYQAYLVMKEGNSFDYTGFDFKKMKPYKNDIWSEPDCVAGISILLYYGYQITGKEEYLDASIECIKSLEDYFGSPLYEALLYFAPTLAASYNAEYGTNFDITGLLDDVLNGSSIPRGGWGSMVGSWGSYNVDGLMGSTTDGGGYAFAMNTFTAAYAMTPLAKYDTRYAKVMGNWLLHVTSNSRYFFADQTNPENQSVQLKEESQTFLENTKGVVPYEGIRKSHNSKTPWFGGDPTVYGWAETDFSLYSGAHTGLIGAISEQTAVEGILKINLNVSETKKSLPMYLYYNPYEESKTIDYEPESDIAIDVFDTVTRTYLNKDISNTTKITIPANEAVIVAEIPSGTSFTKKERAYYVDDMFVYADSVSVGITNYKNNDVVKGKFELIVDSKSTIENDNIKEIKSVVSGKEEIIENSNKIGYSVKELGTGSKSFDLEITMESGLKDRCQIRLTCE